MQVIGPLVLRRARLGASHSVQSLVARRPNNGKRMRPAARSKKRFVKPPKAGFLCKVARAAFSPSGITSPKSARVARSPWHRISRNKQHQQVRERLTCAYLPQVREV